MTNEKRINGVTILGKGNSQSLFNDFARQNVIVNLAKGVKIHAEGAFGDSRLFVVYNDNMDAVELYDEEESPDIVHEYEATAESRGYFGLFIKIDAATCRPYSKRFGIGLYYDESGELVDDETINRSLTHAKAVEEARAAHDKQVKNDFEAQKELARKQYASILKEIGKETYSKDWKQGVKRNITLLLKHTFPGLKFTLRQNCGGYLITWTDGPTENEIMKVAGMFQNIMKRDCWNEDIFEYSATAFTSVFGGVDIISTERYISEELTTKAELLIDEAMRNEKGNDTEKTYMLAKSLGADIYFSNIERSSKKERVNIIAQYISAYVKPEKPIQTVKADGLQIVEYSDKALAIIGDTQKVKEQLKKLGGRFNAKLKCGAGWIFSKKRENELRAVLAIS